MNLYKKLNSSKKINTVTLVLYAALKVFLLWYVFALALKHFVPELLISAPNPTYLLYAFLTIFALLITIRKFTSQNVFTSFGVNKRSRFLLLISFIVFFILLIFEIGEISEFGKYLAFCLSVTFFLMGWMITRNIQNVEVQSSSDSISQKRTTYFCNLAFIIILLFSGFQYLNPSGAYEVVVKQSNYKEIIANFSSLLFDEETESFYVTASPLYLDVELPRSFLSATISFWLKFNSSASDVSISAKHVNGAYTVKNSFAFQPIIEELPPYWKKTFQDGTLLVWKDDESKREYAKITEDITKIKEEVDFNKEKEIQANHNLYITGKRSLTEFQVENELIFEKYEIQIQAAQDRLREFELDSHIPYENVNAYLTEDMDFKKTASFNFSLDEYFKIPEEIVQNYGSESNTFRIRGKYVLLIYHLAYGPLEVNVDYQNTERNSGSDDIEVILSRGRSVITKKVIEDDENSKNVKKNVSILTRAVDPGLYRLEFDSSDDIFTTNVEVLNDIVGVENRYYSIDGSFYGEIDQSNLETPKILYTNSTELKLQTAHTESYQTIKVNDKKYNLNKVHDWIEVDKLTGVARIEIEKGDVILQGDGLFTSDGRSPLLEYKRKYFRTFDGVLQEDLEQYDAIVLQYPQGVETNKDWILLEEKFEIPEVSFVGNRASFKVDLGSLALDSRSVNIKDFTLTFNNDRLTFKKLLEKISAKFKQFFDR